ncbi:MAG: SprT-like domain-containing protein [Bacteroidetes bacterium]|nr:SprT-like domain-containing protein [Bacteroidota bacterium]
MPKQETSLHLLQRFIPEGSFTLIAPYFQTHIIHLTLTNERKSVLGDYRHPTKEYPYHRISINVNLNPYSFLITLLHEIAHLMVFVHFKGKVAPHGKEWKTQFRHIMIPFIGQHFFPKDVEAALLAYLHNPAASTCTDPTLFKALYRYDERKAGYKLLSEMKHGQRFETEDKRNFEIIEHNRTRTRCRDLQNKRVYLFPSISEVRQVNTNHSA